MVPLPAAGRQAGGERDLSPLRPRPRMGIERQLQYLFLGRVPGGANLGAPFPTKVVDSYLPNFHRRLQVWRLAAVEGHRLYAEWQTVHGKRADLSYAVGKRRTVAQFVAFLRTLHPIVWPKGCPAAARRGTSAASASSPKVRVSLLPLPKAAIGPASKSLPRGTLGGAPLVAGGHGYWLEYGYPFQGGSGVLDVGTQVDQLKTVDLAKDDLFSQRAGTVFHVLGPQLQGAETGGGFVGPRRNPGVTRYTASNIDPMSTFSTWLRDGRYVLGVTVSAGTSSAATKLGWSLAELLRQEAAPRTRGPSPCQAGEAAAAQGRPATWWTGPLDARALDRGSSRPRNPRETPLHVRPIRYPSTPWRWGRPGRSATSPKRSSDL